MQTLKLPAIVPTPGTRGPSYLPVALLTYLFIRLFTHSLVYLFTLVTLQNVSSYRWIELAYSEHGYVTARRNPFVRFHYDKRKQLPAHPWT
jgi:hypothetical protein